MASEGEGRTFVTGDLIAAKKLVIGDGYRAKNSELSSAGIPFARAGNIDGGFDFDGADRFPVEDLAKVGDKVSRPGDVVFTSKGTVGRLAYVRPETPRFVYAPQLCFWRSLDCDVIDDRWLYYWMAASEFRTQMLGVKGQTDMADYVSLSDQRRMEITLPHIDRQRAIAAVLGALDDKIEQNRRTGRALEALARATFKAWFVDFEPVKAKAAGATSFPGIPPADFVALPDCLADSKLGTVPDGWEVQTVGDVMRLSQQQIKPQDHPDELFEHFSIPAYDAGQNPVVEPGSGILSQKFVVVPDCVLLSKLNPRIPRVWIPAPANGRRQITSTEFLVAVARPGCTREFLYCLFQQREFRDSLAQSASGTSNSHQRVRPSDLLDHPLVVPPKTFLNSFTEQVIPLMAMREALHAESSKLAALRDYLLPRLLSGRVRVEGRTP